MRNAPLTPQQRTSPALFLALTLFLTSSLGASPDSWADSRSAAQDKGAYTLFNPTPKGQMRELITDRPDKTESPYPVDAGHFQIETDLVTLIRDLNQTSAIFNNINLKAGLTNTSDFQVLFGTFRKDYNTQGAQGLTDLILRYKVNVFGADSEESSFGLIPYLKLPTQARGLGPSFYEAGVIAPYARKLNSWLDLGSQVVLDLKRDGDVADSRYYPATTESATLGLSVGKTFWAYSEIFAQQLFRPSRTAWNLTVDGGVLWQMTPDVQWDAGINIGLTDEADDLNPFVGLSMRY